MPLSGLVVAGHGPMLQGLRAALLGSLPDFVVDRRDLDFTPSAKQEDLKPKVLHSRGVGPVK